VLAKIRIASVTNLAMNVPRLKPDIGRTIAQAVSGWLTTAAARVRTRIWSSRICGGEMALGQIFSEFFGFPCQALFHQFLHPQNHSGQVQ
jgi:hypothetical protein